MLVHRMWLVLLFYLVGVTVLDAALVTAGFSTQAVALATIAVHLTLGFEAGTLRRWSLDRKGWRMLGVVTGQSKIDCERRFFHAWLGEKGEEQDAGTVQLSKAADEPVATTAGPLTGRGAGPVSSEA